MSQTQVRVVNEFGKDVAHDGIEIGEIIVKGNGVVQEEGNTPNQVDGWFHTGDMGTVDKKGHILVIDRKKDIITNGKRISSVELERILMEHSAVQEASIIAIPHEKWGETAHAFVVLHEGQNVTEEELIDFSAKSLDPSECPRAIKFMDELPKTASGKILKARLREKV